MEIHDGAGNIASRLAGESGSRAAAVQSCWQRGIGRDFPWLSCWPAVNFRRKQKRGLFLAWQAPTKVTADAEGHFHVRFFLHGLRHLGENAIKRASQLKVGDELRILVELNNPATRLAVPLLTDDYQMIGWAPRYLVDDLISCVPNAPELSAKIARINVDAAPLNQRILIDYAGRAPKGTQPMSTPDFTPLIE